MRVVHRPDTDVGTGGLLRRGLPVLGWDEGHHAEWVPSCSHVSRPSKRWVLLTNLYLYKYPIQHDDPENRDAWPLTLLNLNNPIF
jgi:hypothetical protein